MSMNVRLVLIHACLVRLTPHVKAVNPVTGEIIVKIAVKDVRTNALKFTVVTMAV